MLPHAKHATAYLRSNRSCGQAALHSQLNNLIISRCSSHTMPAAEEATLETEQPNKKVKRNVALHVGYVGTNYTGLQANRELPQLATIEGVLEKAILAAGMITEANFGDFRKTKWSRSSRTDKGVHSLSTVIGLRILCDDAAYVTDPEGVGYARAINEHLPPDVRVFCVQRTNKSFNARRWCNTRSYEYYLPAAALGLETPDGSTAGDQQKLALLREVLQQYCGYKPFQNYAGNRRQYVGQKAKAARRKQKREARIAEEEAAAAAAAASSSVEQTSTTPDSTQEDDSTQQLQPLAAAAAAAGSADSSVEATSAATATAESTAATTADSTAASTAADSEDADGADGELDAEEVQQYAAAAAAMWEYSGEGPVPPELEWRQQVRFLTSPDPDDPVVKSHYRMIRSFTADDPRPLVPGGVPCLRLEVCGDSFMLHQIRHMVGCAVAIVRGILPRELLEVSLSAPGRVTLPRAPPHTLLLSDSLFSPFPKGWGHEVPLVAQWTGDRLRVREGGQQEVLEFRRQVFDPALNSLLLHEDWDTWSRKVLPRYTYAAEDVVPAVQAHAKWWEELKAKRAAEAATKAAEAAAAKAAAAEAEAAGAEAAAAAAAAEAADAADGPDPAGAKQDCCVQ